MDHLRTVIDPELGVDIVALGLIYEVAQQQDGKWRVLMTLTTPGCPLAPTIEDMIRRAVDDIPDFDAYRQLKIELTWEPPWIPDMMDPETRAQLGLD